MGEPFGVTLPDSFDNTASSSDTGSSPDLAPSGTSDTAPEGKVSENQATGTTSAPKEPMDLDKVESFRFAGRDWTPKELRDAYMMQRDYSKKTAELSENRKYTDNFEADLRTVVSNPSLIGKLKEIYPKFYGELAEKIINNLSGKPIASNTPNQGASEPTVAKDPRIDEMAQEWRDWKKAQQEAETEKLGAWLDNNYDRLGKKYPMADPEVVTARAEIAYKQGAKINEVTLDKLFKASDAEIKARFEKAYKSKVDEQKLVGGRAKDAGPGGAVPGQAPRVARTIKEATAMAIQDLEGRNPHR